MFTDHLFDELVRVTVVAPTRVYFNPIEALLAVALLVRIDLFVKVFFLQLEAEDVAPHPSSDVLCLCLHDVLGPGLPIFGVAVACLGKPLLCTEGVTVDIVALTVARGRLLGKGKILGEVVEDLRKLLLAHVLCKLIDVVVLLQFSRREL